jgi:hypothetical protein
MRQNNLTSKQSFWRSLSTKDRAEALRLSKRMWVMFDDLSREFTDVEVFGKAMELLMRYDQANKEGRCIEFLESLDDSLDGGESDLLERALAARGDVALKWSQTIDDNNRLKQTIDYHNTGKTTRQYTPDENPTLDVLVDQFMQRKQDADAQSSSIKWYSQKSQLFVSILEALNNESMPRITDLSIHLIRAYADTIKRYPANAGKLKATRNLSQVDRIKLTKNLTREKLVEKEFPFFRSLRLTTVVAPI